MKFLLRFAGSRRIKVILLESETLKNQIVGFLKELQLELKSDMMFTRCILCNVELIPYNLPKTLEDMRESA